MRTPDSRAQCRLVGQSVGRSVACKPVIKGLHCSFNDQLSEHIVITVGITKTPPALFSRVLRDSTPRFLHLLVGLSVGWSLVASILASRPLSQPWGSYPCLKAPIPATRPQSQPLCLNPSLLAPISASKPQSQPPGPNPGLQAQIPAYRPKSKPKGQNLSQKAQIPIARKRKLPICVKA